MALKHNVMNIAIIGTAGLPANYGGFETLAENLVNELDNEFGFTVYCSSVNSTDRPLTYRNSSLVYIPLRANGAHSIPYDIASMVHALRSSDVMLILGVSGCLFLPFVRLFSRKRIIAHIDGMEWRREKWGRKRRWFLKISEAMAVKYAHTVIADNLAIQKYIKDEYQKDSTCIEYGGDHVIRDDAETQRTDLSLFSGKEYAIKVCRIEPENNVHIVLEAFSRTGHLALIVVGNWSYSKYGINLRNKYGSCPNIKLMDPIYDKQKLFQLRSNASLYIHGHSAGGTNPSLVEAMYLGLPVIAFDVQYNRETTHNKAVYFKNEGHLIEILGGIDRLDLPILRGDMRDIAEKYYTWSRIAGLYAQLFRNSSAAWLEHE